MGLLLSCVRRESGSTPSIAVDQGLCGKCTEFEQTILCQNADTSLRVFNHYQYFGQICSAAQLGCQLCGLFEAGILHTQFEDPGSDFHMSRDPTITSVTDVRRVLLGRDTAFSTMTGQVDAKYRLRLMSRGSLTKGVVGVDATTDPSKWCFDICRSSGVDGRRESEAFYMICVSAGMALFTSC